MPSELPKELIEARLAFGSRLAVKRRESMGMSLEQLRAVLREKYNHPISRERLRQIERDGTYDPDNETVKLVAEILDEPIPDGLKRPAAKKAPGGEGSPPRISLARAKKDLDENPDLAENVRQGKRLRIARIEKGLTQAGLVRAINERLDGPAVRVGFISEAERGVPSLPRSAVGAVQSVLGIDADLSLVARDDGPELASLSNPLNTLLLSTESWMSGKPFSPAMEPMVRSAVGQVREALQAVSA